MSKKISATDAVKEIGRRAACGDKEALETLRELSDMQSIPSVRRNLAAKLWVDAGGRF